LARHELCLRYVLGAPAVSVVIPGSADPDHVRANVRVSGGLDPAVRQRVNQLWLDRKVRGTYNGSG
jgi:predicted aldo/keto reductase-like oxidoreductase